MSDQLNNDQTSDQKSKERYLIIDMIRGLAVILMIKFHVAYDMRLFGWTDIDFQKDSYWYLLPRFIVFLFLFAVGACQTLEHRDGIKWDKVKKRFIKIFGCALLVSISTFILFRDRWIYFGTLHCIAFCSVLVLPFMKKPSWAFNAGLFLVFSNLFVPKDLLPLSEFIGHKSMDYIPPYPWLGVALMGVGFVNKGLHQYHIPENTLTRSVAFLSRNALLIYLIHQPIIYGVCLLINKVFSNG